MPKSLGERAAIQTRGRDYSNPANANQTKHTTPVENQSRTCQTELTNTPPDAARGEVTGVRESDGGAESVSRPSFRIETHGCKLNMADSQVLAGQFLTRGFRAGREDEEPNVYVVNTCTVTAVADKKARQAISSARRRFPEAIVVAAGCYPERDPAALDALQAVDLIYGNRDKAEMVGVVSGILGRQMGEIDEEELNSAEAPISIGRSRAAVKIQEGCDQVCAYCIVPRVRGRERRRAAGRNRRAGRRALEGRLPRSGPYRHPTWHLRLRFAGDGSERPSSSRSCRARTFAASGSRRCSRRN